MTIRPDAAIGRLVDGYYNSRAYDAAENPGGMDESDDGLVAGHVDNFPAALGDVGAVVSYAGALAGTVTGAAVTVAADRAAAQTAATIATSGASQAVWCGVAAGTAAALVLTPTVAISALFDGLTVRFLAAAANPGGGTTVKVSALPPVPLLDPKGSALPVNTLAPGMLVSATCSGGSLYLGGGAGSALPDPVTNSGRFLRSDGAVWVAEPLSEAAILPTADAPASADMVTNRSYIATGAGRVALRLPASSAKGDLVEVLWYGSGGWSITQRAGQSIIWGSTTTTAGTTDGLQSAGGGATVRLKCVQANTVWEVVSYAGTVVQIGATTQAWDPTKKGSSITISGGLTATTNGTAPGSVLGFAIPSAGKWYWEIYISQYVYETFVGVATAAFTSFNSKAAGEATTYGWYSWLTSRSWVYTGSSYVTMGAPWAAAGVVGIALDMDAGKMFFSYGGVYINAGNPLTGANPSVLVPAGPLYPVWGCADTSSAPFDVITFRPSPSAWSNPAPTGFNRLP